jgi:calpain-15
VNNNISNINNQINNNLNNVTNNVNQTTNDTKSKVDDYGNKMDADAIFPDDAYGLIDGEEDYGVNLPPIPYPTSGSPFYFSDEVEDKRSTFSTHEEPVGKSEWHDFHMKIKGEFYDKTFCADDKKSLVGLGRCEDAYDRGKLEYFKSITWKRLSYVYPDVQVIKGGIDNRDIYQGSIGNCYLLSSIASVSEHPDRIQRLLEQQKRSPKGAYSVALCITGQFQEYFIDDMVPCKNNRVAFCHSDEGELWAILVEKAYAKAYGGYWNTGAGGQSQNALMDLTGAPCETLTWKEQSEKNDLFKRLLNADKMKYIMNAGTKGSGENKNSTGIISGHAYTLVGAYKLPNGDEIVKLRNPWGSGEWTGDYSDSSSKWTPSLKQQLGWSNKDDGIFFMPVRDFINEFETAAICHYRDDYKLSSLFDINPSDAFACYQFNVDQAGDYYFGLSQDDKNKHPAKHTYGMLSIVVGRVLSNGDIEYVGGKGYPRRDVWFMGKCEPGQYLAFVTSNWDNDNTEDLSIWAYGPKHIAIERVKHNHNMQKIPDLFAKCIKNYVRLTFELTILGQSEEE